MSNCLLDGLFLDFACKPLQKHTFHFCRIPSFANNFHSPKLSHKISQQYGIMTGEVNEIMIGRFFAQVHLNNTNIMSLTAGKTIIYQICKSHAVCQGFRHPVYRS